MRSPGVGKVFDCPFRVVGFEFVCRGVLLIHNEMEIFNN